MHIFHKWSRWTLIASPLSWIYDRQWRECETCGIREERYVN